ncbi:MAG: gliding motility protein GldM [Bacteroidetes bacterium]|nr:gliding motility protein GldM [Bacteroidota bacterium]
MSIPKEPRQIMINLMYLVLTAMLALNVSSEILHAFETINQSITASNKSIEDKNSKLYAALEEQMRQPGQEARVKPFNDKALQAKSNAAEVIKFLDDWKNKIIEESGGREENGEIKRKDNIDASTLLLVEQKHGDEIRKKLLDLRTSLAALVDPRVKDQMLKDMPIRVEDPAKSDNNPQADWSTAYFHNMPTMAVITLLAKFQNDVRNSEAIIVNELANEAGSQQMKFDAIKAIAVPKNSYVLAGQKVEASILLAAYNNQINPSVSANSGHITKVEQGLADWETVAAGAGLQTVKGNVSLNMNGQNITKDYEFTYMVGSEGASMQLDKMNVFYIGVPNPITISAAGYSIEDVSVAIPGATITPKDKGHYEVMVTKPGNIVAEIIAKTKDAGAKTVGKQEIRVKRIPDPVARVGSVSGGPMLSSLFKAQLGVLAALDNFDFDARFVVTSFDFSIVPKRGEMIGPFPVKGARFDANKQVPDAINRLRPGDKVYIEEIKARGPDGTTRNLNTIGLTLR